MILGLQDKLKLEGVNHKKEVDSLNEKLELEYNLSQSLRSEIEDFTKKQLKLENSLKEVSVISVVLGIILRSWTSN